MKRLLLIILVVLSAFGGWSQNKVTQGTVEDYSVRMNIGETNSAQYTWLVTPANGTSTDIGSVVADSAHILWDGPVGIYSLSVQAVDGNGCLSETIIRQIEIIKAGDLIFDSNYPNTIVCSDLAGGTDGSDPPHSESIFNITYNGNANLLSAKITVRNPDGDFVDLSGAVLPDQNNPEIEIDNPETDKQIEFSVADSWENNTGANVTFSIKLISGITSDNLEITAEPSIDIERSVTVLQKPVIEFK
jgi:hypothetical protein